MTTTDPAIRALAREIAGIKRQMRSAGRASQAAYRSVELTDGPVSYYDEDGTERLRIGDVGENGEFTITELGTEPPPIPEAPDVTTRPGAVEIIYDGSFVDSTTPIDLAYFEIHASHTPDFFADDTTQIGTFASPQGGTFVFASGVADGEWYIAIQAVNRSGVESDKSAEVGPVAGGAYPPSEPTSAPTTSPALKASGTTSTIVLEAENVDAGTEIQYHMSTVDGFTADETTLYVASEAQVVVVTGLINGDPLDPEATYYFKALAHNVLGDAPEASAQVSGKIDLNNVDELIAAKLVVGFILTGTIQVGQMLIDANSGITINRPGGGYVLNFPVDGVTPLEMTAQLVAETLNVKNNFVINGAGQLNGDISIANGIVAPKLEPSLAGTWLKYNAGGLGDEPYDTDQGQTFSGMCEFDTNTFAVAIVFFGAGIRLLDKRTVAEGGGGLGGLDMDIVGFPDPTTGQEWCVNYYPWGGVAVGETNSYYLLGSDNDRSGDIYLYKIFRRIHDVATVARTANVATITTTVAHGYIVGDQVTTRGINFGFGSHKPILSVPNSTSYTVESVGADVATTAALSGATVEVWDKTGEIRVGDLNAFDGFIPRIACWSNGDVAMLWSGTDKAIKIRTYDPDLLNSINQRNYITLTKRYDWGGLIIGPYGPGGADRVICIPKAGATCYVFDQSIWSAAPVRKTAEEFTRAQGATVMGAMFDGTRIVSYDNFGHYYRYGRNPEELLVSAKNTWLDPVGTTHETDAGPTNTIAIPPRRIIATGLNETPPDINNADPSNLDKANQSKIYLSDDGGASWHYDTFMDPWNAAYEVLASLPTGTAPLTNGFVGAAVTAGSIRSIASDPIGSLIRLSGAGDGRVGPWRWDADGNDVSLRGKLTDRISSSTANIPSNVWTTVTGWGVSGEEDEDYTSGTAGGESTWAEPGLFLFTASVNWSAGSTGRRLIGIFRNGAEQRRNDIPPAGTNQMVNNISHIMRMDVGDVLAIRVHQTTGGALALSSTTGHNWQATKLAD